MAASLAYLQKRILLLDLDPQGNATMGSGMDKNKLTRTSNDVLLNECDISEAIFENDFVFQLLEQTKISPWLK